MIHSAKLQKENVRPEELISDDFLAVTVTELHVTDHQDSVENHGQCNDPRDMCSEYSVLSVSIGHLLRTPTNPLKNVIKRQR